ncbi:MAG: EpsG family protein [Firmicutes bacterium]|nr:EpsG family protein [Bacillota bacterium]
MTLVMVLGLLALKIGYRDRGIGTDYLGYYKYYEQARNGNLVADDSEPGYQALIFLGSLLRIPPELFFATVAFLQMWLTLWAIRVIMTSAFGKGSRADTLTLISAAFLLIWPFYWNSILNVLRQGLAIPLVLVGYTRLQERRFAKGLVALAAASSFHWSSVAFAAVSLISIGFHRLTIWLTMGSVAIYMIQISGNILQQIETSIGVPLYSMVMDYGAGATYRSGYRYDFLAFSMIPLILSMMTGIGHFGRPYKQRLQQLYSTLLLPFLWFGFGNYSDRLLLPAWIAMPVVLVGLTLSKVKLGLGARLVLCAAALFVGVALLTLAMFPENIFVIQGIVRVAAKTASQWP